MNGLKRIGLMAAAFAVMTTTTGWADVILPKVISSRMILQREVAVPVWGWADQGEEVTVEFAGQRKKAMPDAKGKWMVKMDPLAASAKSRVMTIRGKNTISLNDVLVGEVWLASGQSNMEWTFKHIAKEERDFVRKQKDNKLLRAFHVSEHVQANKPLDDTIGTWKDCNDMVGGDLKSVSAVGFFFALKLQQELGIPVAFIDANWGGQRIECFIPEEGYKAVGLKCRKHGGVPNPKAAVTRLRKMEASFRAAAEHAEKGIFFPYREDNVYGWSENGIYNAMIAPVASYAIRGAIWYQGESNRRNNDYFNKLQALSAGWSKVFNVKDIPLYQVQIAPFVYNKGNPADATLCNNIWKAQYRGAKEIPGVGVVAIHDTKIDIKNIHPVFKRTVGERLAAQALKKQYGKDVVTAGPAVASATLDGTKAVVAFSDIDQGLTTTDGKAPSWFEVSGDGKTFVKADAAIKGNTVEVSSPAVAAPKFVRMGWADIAIPNLADKNGWPVFAFPAQPVK